MNRWDKIVTDLILQQDGSWKEPPKPAPTDFLDGIDFDLYCRLLLAKDSPMVFIDHFARLFK